MAYARRGWRGQPTAPQLGARLPRHSVRLQRELTADCCSPHTCLLAGRLRVGEGPGEGWLLNPGCRYFPGPAHNPSSRPDPQLVSCCSCLCLECWVDSPSCSPGSPSSLQDRHFHLRVFVEVVLPNGHVAGTQEVTLICPKPGHAWTLAPCLAP